MTDAQPRSQEQRKADTLVKLTAPGVDVWVATAGADTSGHASPYLVPLSLAWIEERIVLATEAKPGVPVAGEVPAGVAQGYAAQADWDPREAGGQMLFLVLRPLRIQAWREVDELPGRALMRDGAWLI